MFPLVGVLTLVFWGIVAILLVILFAIARFYQATSGQASHYRWFLAPAVLLNAGALRYATLGSFHSDALGDLLMVAGSLVLTALGSWLLHLMTGGRR
jgi:hypothetical protein